MVVLKPMFEGEVIKRCPKCSHIGLGSPIKERRSFYHLSKGVCSYRSDCCTCSKKSSAKWVRANHERRLARRRKTRAEVRSQMTPEQREKAREYSREWQKRRKNDPAFKKKRKEADARFREKHRERLNEQRRIDRRLKREREGKWKVPEIDTKEPTRRTGIVLPIGPPRNWLNELVETKMNEFLLEGLPEKVAATKATSAVISDLKSSARSFYSWRYEDSGIDLATIDRLASRHGGITMYQIYQNYRDCDGYSIFLCSDLTWLRVDHWKPEK